ncbi:MAG: sugar phosphate isomerase/epimerase, partial [Chitinophagaceae bacterium]|nr:sugar phosphate isomerase/epimerase [Chitinophagaceae bacterium]
MITRRSMLKRTLAVSSILHPALIKELMAESAVKRIRIGACDWSLGKGSNIEAFKVAKSIGLEGIMVDMGSEQNNLHIRQREIQKSYLKESAQTGIAISSLALGIYNRVPFHSDSRVQEWLRGSIDAAKNL